MLFRSDNQVNRLRTPLTATLSANATATFRARARWVRGHPEILLRLRGKWLETVVALELPARPGTPGEMNSRREVNGGPAIYDLAQYPILPRAGEAVVVSARAHDPDGLGSVQLRYRVDPGGTGQAVSMVDDGTGGDRVAGDGVYSGRVAGQGKIGRAHV